MKLLSFIKSRLSYNQKLFTAITSLAVLILIINLLLYKNDRNVEENFIKSYLKIQLNYIQNIIIKDIQNIIDNKQAEHLVLIKNFYNTNGSLIYENGIVGKINNKNNTIVIDFSTMFELIDNLAKDNFQYNIELDNKVLNGSIQQGSYDIAIEKKIFNSFLLIKVKVLQQSLLKLNSYIRIKQKIIYRIICSIIIFSLLSYLFFKYYQNINNIQIMKGNLENLIKFYKREKEEIVKRYEYTRKDFELLQKLESIGLIRDNSFKNYFPLFLLQNINSDKIYSLNLKELNLNELVNNYNLINNSNIELQIYNKTINNSVDSFLDNEILKQLIESIVRNFLQLKCNDKEKGLIKFTYCNEQIEFECNIVKLNKAHLIKWSKNIFDNTGNPFILDFDQIFKILEIFNCKYDINYKENFLVLSINFNQKNIIFKSEYHNNVINIAGKFIKK